jgi:hypothetical protein
LGKNAAMGACTDASFDLPDRELHHTYKPTVRIAPKLKLKHQLIRSLEVDSKLEYCRGHFKILPWSTLLNHCCHSKHNIIMHRYAFGAARRCTIAIIL